LRTGTARRLHLLRHAKSAWDDPTLADRDRPLTPRGRRAGAALARHLETADVRPGLVLCSPAARARQTLELVLPALGSPDVEFEESLYHASAERIRRLVAALPGDQAEVLLVGHNPGLQDVVLALALPGRLRRQVESKLPTGALATLESDVPGWEAFTAGPATLTSVVLPRALER